MIRLGGPVFTKDEDPRAIARAHREAGYRAAYCPTVELKDSARIREIADAFEQEDVWIAEVGAWCNLIGPDEAERKKNIDYVCERLALADEIGALSCVDFIGSVAPNPPHNHPFEPHPDNLSDRGFELAVETVRHIIDTVKPKRAKFCLEFMQWVLPDSPESCLDLIRAVDRPQFGAHLDPVNIILSPRQYFNNGDLIQRCFELLGPWIIGGHAKDIKLRNELALHFDEVIPGQGYLNYAVYLRELNKLNKDMPLMLEHLQTEAEYEQAKRYIVTTGVKEGVSFGGTTG
jgi:sugar phosphate isomerase/epimerase